MGFGFILSAFRSSWGRHIYCFSHQARLYGCLDYRAHRGVPCLHFSVVSCLVRSLNLDLVFSNQPFLVCLDLLLTMVGTHLNLTFKDGVLFLLLGKLGLYLL